MSKLNGSLFLSKVQIAKISAGKKVKIRREGKWITVAMKGIKDPAVKLEARIAQLQAKLDALKHKKSKSAKKEKVESPNKLEFGPQPVENPFLRQQLTKKTDDRRKAGVPQ